MDELLVKLMRIERQRNAIRLSRATPIVKEALLAGVERQQKELEAEVIRAGKAVAAQLDISDVPVAGAPGAAAPGARAEDSGEPSAPSAGGSPSELPGGHGKAPGRR